MMQNSRGFTLIELLVAVTIMAVGFLAVSQMQFLSFRQKTIANEGVQATNVIQFAADRDLAEIKKRYLHNSFTYLQGLNAGSPIDGSSLDYCNGPDKLCANCPCDPFDVVITDATDDNSNETTCSAVDLENFDPDKIVYKTFMEDATCDDACPANTECLYIVRSSETNVIDNGFNPDTLIVSINYGVKNLQQILDDDNKDVISIRETLATQHFEISGHIAENWDQYVTPWVAVNIPHVP